MKKATVVIGANYGDEAKGLVTDFFCSQMGAETLVVRFNGGAQAGHTVTTPDGKRHEFHSFGSGSFLGCPTFFSKFFVCNPLIFLQELGELKGLGLDPTVYVDPRASVTTPYDMMINQLIEDTRGVARHGSCGVGFGETVARCEHPEFTLRYADLADTDKLRARLQKIRYEWVTRRLAALDIIDVPQPYSRYFTIDGIIDKFIEDIGTFLKNTRPAPADLLRRNTPLVFEGAQGLLLDQDYGCFPHVTRSNTGMKNVVDVAAENGIDAIDTYYLTRSYLTRHGAGPLAHESPTPVYSKIVDLTNRPNAYQGSLRFAYLDIDTLADSIVHDIKCVPQHIDFSHNLSVSCMDQIDNDAIYRVGGKLITSSPERFLDIAQDKTGARSLIASHGPTRSTIKRVVSMETAA
jgi:adenylosuccinate synthase